MKRPMNEQQNKTANKEALEIMEQNNFYNLVIPGGKYNAAFEELIKNHRKSTLFFYISLFSFGFSCAIREMSRYSKTDTQ